MRCAFCGSGEDNVKTRMANAEVGGLVKLPVCPVDETYIDDTFSTPLTMRQLANMQRAVNA